MTVRHQQDRFAYPIVADPGFRVNCGIISCSIYFSRSLTKNMIFPANFAAAVTGHVLLRLGWQRLQAWLWLAEALVQASGSGVLKRRMRGQKPVLPGPALRERISVPVLRRRPILPKLM
jgi:hypothetical protein